MAIIQILKPTLRRSIRQRRFRQPNTKVVNGTFGVPAAGLPCFWRRFAPIDSEFARAAGNFEEL
jgi:hypothetical protein